ncbi:class I SAM-dependent methyltransferase [Burkholderiales bacterium]|jgi:hypothetical protein|nr:class I SAM-dependent methyltransferase [Burkholderiales bacterium]
MSNIIGNENIYEDGTYVKKNPTLHAEDAHFKFGFIQNLLQKCEFGGATVRVLDVGGGAGVLGRLVCDYLVSEGYEVICDAYDLSEEMLAEQIANNAYICSATSDFSKIKRYSYDLVLLVDVIEHVHENAKLAKELNNIGKYFLYNVPIERNLFDWLRNIYMRDSYYISQRESLGHINFYSYAESKNFIRTHHYLIDYIFAGYARLLLESPFPDYVVQRSNYLRKLELIISRFIYCRLSWLAPWVIQGSVFALASKKKNI